jgi:hypothetical protein
VAAAAAVVVFLTGWGVARLSAPDGTRGRESATDVWGRDADAEYAAASQRVLETLGQGGISPEAAAQLRKDLATMDEAVNTLRAALEERPASPQLERQLTTEVRRRNHVLQQIAGIQIAGLHVGGNE